MGCQVAARLPAPRPRIVFCTAYDQFAIEAFELHAVDYVLKPVNRTRLEGTIGRIAREINDEHRQRRERDAAVRTQRRLMPEHPPEGAGLDCAGACIPAEGVGGDYYDYLQMDRHQLGLVVGDVSGKGMYAGLLAAALQARLQAITASSTASAGEVITELNRLTAGTIESNRFATVFFAAFDSGDIRLDLRERGTSSGACGVRDRHRDNARRDRWSGWMDAGCALRRANRHARPRRRGRAVH